MRVAALVTQPRGGPVDHALDVACELAARGHDSHVIGPVAEHAERMRDAGVLWHDVEIRTKTDLRGARELRRLLRRLQPDVLHCQDRRAGLVGRLFGRRAARLLVYTVHGVPDGLSDLVEGNVRVAPRTRRDTLLYLHVEHWIDRIVPTRIVVPCEALVPYVVDHVKTPAGRVHVVPNGIDPARFAPAEAARSTSRPTALWLGLMVPVKRVDRLVNALIEVAGLRLILVGDGPERPAIEALVAQQALDDRVEFRGYVTDPSTVFAEADLFVLPSGAEACPLALLQAMSCGLPVVASRVGGIPDVVRTGVEGVLVDAADPAGLAAALQTLTSDADARHTMGTHARQRITSAYSLKICVDKLLEVYRP